MSFMTILSWLVIGALCLGLIDLVIGNRLGLGEETEKGILSTGRLLLIMTGFMTLTPLLAEILSPVVTPILTSVGCDPSAFAGMFLANDSGGAALAGEMAIDPDAGRYHGLIVGSMLGFVVVFMIAITISFTTQRERPTAMMGLVAGILPIPVGCVVGGLVAGLDAKMVLVNTIPCALLSVLLLAALIMLKDKIIIIFNIFGKFMLCVSYLGLVTAGMQSLLGFKLFGITADLAEIFSIICNIGIFLAGAFPLLAIVMRILRGPLAKLAGALRVNELELSGLIATLANNLPAVTSLKEMTPRGILLNMSFMVSATCVFGDHMAYTAQVDPGMVSGMVAGKLVAAFISLMIGLRMAKKLDTIPEAEPARNHAAIATGAQAEA